MEKIRVKVDGLRKKYRIGGALDTYGRLSESLWDAIRSPVKWARHRPGTEEDFWALDGVSLEVQEGEVVGIIGRNGAGKTTLLKILSRITEPTQGTAKLNGRVSALLEVGTGFHPELTGRENIFLNGAILGMRRAETLRKFDEIVAFSEVEKFLDTPVKRFSSGMHVRLAFAVAAHLEPEILIVDEVLSVGDAAFQRRCLGKMGQVSQEGRTVVFVSHNMAAVEGLCSRAVVLDQGKLSFAGSAHEAVEKYLKDASPDIPLSLEDRVDRRGSGRLRLSEFIPDMVCGKPGRLAFRYTGKGPLQNVTISLGILTLRGEWVANLSNEWAGNDLDTIPPEGWLVCNFDRVPILPGAYTFNVYCNVNGMASDWIDAAGAFEVKEGDFFGNGRMPATGYASVVVPHRWSVASDRDACFTRPV